MKRVPAWLLASVLVIGLGCHHRQVAYGPALGMDELAAGLRTPAGDYALLTDQQTEGRFGCVLGIAKLVPTDPAARSPLIFVSVGSPDEAYWAEQMRGVAALQKVVFLRPRSIKPEEQSTAILCEAAVRLGAQLLLVYAPRQLGPNSAQVLGVLYEAQTRQPLATVQASARFQDEDELECSPGTKRGDHRDQDAAYQAQRKFEANTLACLRELMHRDTPPTTTQPNKWQQPFIERWWIDWRDR